MKFSFIFIFTVIFSYALNINEAVELGIKNSKALKSKVFDIKVAQEELKIIYADFYPKIDLNYARIKVKETTNKSANAKLSYNFLTSFLAIYRKDVQNLSIEALQQSRAVFKQDLELNIRRVYINYLKAKELQKVQKQNVKSAEQLLEDTKKKFSQKLISKNDMLKVSLDKEQKALSLLESKKLKKMAFLKLKNILNYEELKEEDIENINFNYTINLPLKDLQDAMLTNRSEFASFDLNKKILQKQIDLTNFTYLPSASFSYTHKKNYNKMIKDNYTKEIGISFNLNLFSGFKTEATKAKIMHQYSKALENEAQKKQDLIYDLKNVLENYKLSIKEREVSKLALDQAQENHKLVNEELKANLKTITDMLNATSLLAKAQNHYASSKYDIIINIYELERMVQYKLQGK